MIRDNFTILGLGTSRIASLGDRMSKLQAKNLLETALKSQIKLIDTADTYGSGDAERMIGRAIEKNCEAYFIITKAGLPHMALPAALSPLNQFGKKIYQKLSYKNNYSKDYLITAIQKSLKRLNTTCVDAFLLHEPSLDELRLHDDFHEGLAYIKAKGWAKNIGISTNDLGALKLAVDRKVVDLVQTSLPYSLSPETVFARCKAMGLPVVVNQVLRIKSKLESDFSFVKELQKHGLNTDSIFSILLHYAYYHKKADAILIGSKNPMHVKQNGQVLKNKNDTYVHIFSLLDTIQL